MKRSAPARHHGCAATRNTARLHATVRGNMENCAATKDRCAATYKGARRHINARHHGCAAVYEYVAERRVRGNTGTRQHTGARNHTYPPTLLHHTITRS